MEPDELQGTIHKGPKIKYSESYCWKFRILSFGPKRLMKRQIFEQKAFLHERKTFSPKFSQFIWYKNLKEHFIWIHEVFWQKLCKLWYKIRKNQENHIFQKKTIDPLKKKRTFSPIFFQITLYWRHQITFSSDRQGILANMIQVTGSFFDN